MSRPLQFTSWEQLLKEHFQNLSTAVVAVLALYSFGLILARTCGLTSVVGYLAEHLRLAANAVRKRLREFYLDAQDKSGVKNGIKRRDFDVTTAFAPLLRWVLSLWTGQHLPLAIDVTNLGDRFHVLCVSVVVHATALPVAWKIFYGGQKTPWNPAWIELLTHLQDAVPDNWIVVVLSDRGLESPELFDAIVALGWHPLMRIKKGAKFRPADSDHFAELMSLVPAKGQSRNLSGLAYSGQKMPATLLMRWEEGYSEPWFVLTDLPPESAEAVWYGLRTWIEQGFKFIKGGGWQWDQTRMEDPRRVERLWLAMAVATVWVVAVGVSAEVEEERRREQEEAERRYRESASEAAARRAAEAERLRAQLEGQRRSRAEQESAKPASSQKSAGAKGEQVYRPERSGATARRRSQRVSKRGLVILSAARERGEACLPQHLHPEPWPSSFDHAAPQNQCQLSPEKT